MAKHGGSVIDQMDAAKVMGPDRMELAVHAITAGIFLAEAEGLSAETSAQLKRVLDAMIESLLQIQDILGLNVAEITH